MPSFAHEILVDMFRGNGRLAAELLRRCAGIAVEHTSVDEQSIDLSQVTSTEYRADAVAVLRDRDGRAVAGVIVEVQRQKKRRKLLAWPVYVAALRARFDCPAVLLVIAPDPAIATWARRRIEIGHPGFQLTPLVVGFADIPRVRDRTAASDLPELATLSAMAHPELEIAEVAISAISNLPEEQARLYLDVILSALPAATRQTLEARMKGYQYQSDFARNYYGQGMSAGLEKGRKEGLEKGRRKGRKEGRDEGLRAAVITLARTKLGELSASEIAAIDTVSDPQVLTGLIAALGRARSAASVRAALACVRSG